MPDELRARYRAALGALVQKHRLDLSEKTTLHSRWLAWWLWGKDNKPYRYRVRWLDPPSEDWRVRSRLEAFEHLVGLPESLVQSLIESWRGEYYMRGARGYVREGVGE